MKKRIIVFAFVLINISVLAQADYCRGFESGYKSGYCYGADTSCKAIVPACPPALPKENANSWDDGYNRGFELGTKDKNKSTRKKSSEHFQQSVGIHIIAVGDYGSPSVGIGLYYAPRIVFKLNDINSFNFGTNIQYIQGGDGFGLGLPLMLGYSWGSGSTCDSDQNFGIFFNFGISQVLYSEDEINFRAPIFEGGIRLFEVFELRTSIVKQINSPARGFLYAIGVGYNF